VPTRRRETSRRAQPASRLTLVALRKPQRSQRLEWMQAPPSCSLRQPQELM
jgi:hypothetical protein